MRYICRCLSIFCVAMLGTPAVTQAFEMKLSPEQIKEATACGVLNKGKDVFESPHIKSARFGEYPQGEGGLIMSKFVEVAVVSAMKALKEKTITQDDVKEIEGSQTFNVIVVVANESLAAPEDVQITLVQGTNNILPQKTTFGMMYKDNKQSIVGSFQCSKINPNANTAILVKTRKSLRKYKIDFSDVK